MLAANKVSTCTQEEAGSPLHPQTHYVGALQVSFEAVVAPPDASRLPHLHTITLHGQSLTCHQSSMVHEGHLS